MEYSDHKDVAVSRLCQDFEQTLSALRAGTQANTETLEEGIGKLADAKQSFDLQIADAIGYATSSEFWEQNVFYQRLKKATPEGWQEVQKLRTKAESLRKELAKRLAQRPSVERLAQACSDFHDQLRHLRDATQAGTLEEHLGQLNNAKQSFELQVAAAVACSTDSESWKERVFYQELKKRAPERWQEVQKLRTEAESLQKEVAKRRSVERLILVCSDFHDQLRHLRNAAQAGTLEEHLSQLEKAKESFELQVAAAIAYSTDSESWKRNVFYRELKKHAPRRCQEVQKLRTEAESLQKQLAQRPSVGRRLAQRRSVGRLVQVCLDFHDQLRLIRDAAQAGTVEEHLGQLQKAKQSFDLKVAHAIGFPTKSEFWKQNVFYQGLKRHAPTQWEQVRKLRTEADFLQKQLAKRRSVERLVQVCSDFRQQLRYIHDSAQAGALEEHLAELENAKLSFELQVANAIGYPTDSDSWKNLVFYPKLRERAPERWHEVRDLRTEAKSLRKELAKRLAQRPSVERLAQVCSDFHEQLRHLRDATQVGTLEEHLGQLNNAKQSFELQVAAAVACSTDSESWRERVFYQELKERAPERWQEVQKLRTEADSLQKEVATRLAKRRSVERLILVCSDFHEQLRHIRNAAEAGTVEEHLGQLQKAKQSFDLKVAHAIGYPTDSDSWKNLVFYPKLRERAPERWHEVRDLRTEAKSLRKELAKRLAQRPSVERLAQVCSDFHEQLRHLRDATQVGTLEEHLGQLNNAKQSFELQVAAAVACSTDSESWRECVFYQELKERAPERWQEVQKLRTEADSLQKEVATRLAKGLAQRPSVERLAQVCSDFREQLLQTRDPAQTASVERRLSQLENARQSFELEVATAIAYSTDSESWKRNVFYRELKKRAPARCEEVRKLRTEADSLQKELAKRPSVERLTQVCSDFREQLRQTRDPAQTASVEQRLSQLENARQGFELEVATAIGWPTKSEFWKKNVFYEGLRKWAPERCDEVRDLRTEANFLQKELAQQLVQRRSVERLAQVCSDFHEQLRHLRDAAQAGTPKEHLSRLENATQDFDLKVATAIAYSTASDSWKILVFYAQLGERAPERLEEVRKLRTEAHSLQKELAQQLAQRRLGPVCLDFHEQLRHLHDAAQPGTLEERLSRLENARQDFELKVATAISHSTASGSWKERVSHQGLKIHAPARYEEVRDLRTDADSLQKELAQQLAQRRLGPVCLDFHEQLRHLRDPAQAGTLEERLSRLEKVRQNFDLKVATTIAYSTDLEFWKRNVFYQELKNLAPERCEEVRNVRTDADSLQKELANQLAQRRLGPVCLDFHEQLQHLHDAAQAGTLEERLSRLEETRQDFELKVATIIAYSTDLEFWRRNLSYRELQKRVPGRYEEVRRLSTEANSLKKKLERQLSGRSLNERLISVCSVFREQLRQTRHPAQATPVEERLSQLADAKQNFERQVATIIGYSADSQRSEHNLSDRTSRKSLPERWKEIWDLRTEAGSLLNSLKTDIEFICAKFGHELNSIRRQLQSNAESLETRQIELGIAIENFTTALGNAIDQEITEAVWQDISQFRASLLKGIPGQLEKILALREQALTTARALAKVESPLLATPLLPQARQTLRDRARVGSSVRTEKTFFVEARQLRPLLGEPNYRVLPADLWMQIAQAAAATVSVDASDEVLFLPHVDRPKLRVITNGSLALPGGKLMAIETEKALIVRGSIKLEACVAGFVYAGACELGKLAVKGLGRVNIEHLKAPEDYAKAQVPQIDVAAGFMLCRKIEWPYPTIDCLQLTYVEWPIAPAHPFLRDRESRTSLSAYEERKQRMMKDIHAAAKVSVPRVVARMPPPRQSSVATTSRNRAP
jgi:predicted transcriptional regulator